MFESIYVRALKAWGEDAQLGMIQEECAELIKAINKRRRGLAADVEVIEECVDVELLLNQAREIFKDKLDTWEKIKAAKLERLNDLLKG